LKLKVASTDDNVMALRLSGLIDVVVSGGVDVDDGIQTTPLDTKTTGHLNGRNRRQFIMAGGRNAASASSGTKKGAAAAASRQVDAAASTGGLPSRTTKKKTSRPAADFELLREICAAEKGAHLKAKKTIEAYKGHTKRGFEFLATLAGSLRQTPGKAQPLWREHGSFDVDEFERAFVGPPNRYSATALESFLVEKCLNQGLGISTADGIHAAFKQLWDEMCVP
jgi:hypothetical protein